MIQPLIRFSLASPPFQALRAAVVHVIGDSVQAIGVLIAAALIWWKQNDPRWLIVDPLVTCLFSVFVGTTSWQVTKEIVDILMENYPTHLDANQVRTALLGVPGVVHCHDLHVWSITAGKTLLMAHLDIEPTAAVAEVLDKAEAALKSLGITHSTLQVEPVTRHSAAFLQDLLKTGEVPGVPVVPVVPVPVPAMAVKKEVALPTMGGSSCCGHDHGHGHGHAH